MLDVSPSEHSGVISSINITGTEPAGMRSKVLGRSLKVTLQAADATCLIAAASVTGTGPAALAHADLNRHRYIGWDREWQIRRRRRGRTGSQPLVCLSARPSTEID
jgi:hypothetical protein